MEESAEGGKPRLVPPCGGLRARFGRLIPETCAVLALAAAASVVFTVTDLDIRIQRLFFEPAGPDHWPVGDRAPWRQLYLYGTYPAVLVACWALVALLRSALGRQDRRRTLAAIFLLAVMFAGPVGLVNGVFKSYWGRPRPKETVEFGGSHVFIAAGVPGPLTEGRSFPCGHATMGFYFGVFYFLLKERRPAAAAAALGGSLAYGSMIGVARMAQGGHFASDVVWGAVMTYAPMIAAYHLTLRLPALRRPEQGAQPRRRVRIPMLILAGMAGLVGAAALLLATPFSRNVSFSEPRPEQGKPVGVSLVTRKCRVEIVVGPAADAAVSAEGSASGFGLPWNTVRTSVRRIERPDRRILIMNIAPKGVFTELDMRMRMYAAQDLSRIEARIEGADAAVILDADSFPPMHIVVTGGKLDIGAALKSRATIRTMPSGAVECTIAPETGTR